ncbi:MAG: DUF4252 domain-containing protein [Wenzhouxiangellaceae bacterium]|nr:DUF4252 domain-containing protein [Wenzhouxiangellaceae bacterium]
MKTIRTMIKTTITATAFAMAMASPGLAQEPPGRVDMAPVSEAAGSLPKVNLNFQSAMVRAFAESMRGTNEALADLLDSIQGVRVMVYEDVDGAAFRGVADELNAELASRGWTQAMEVRDGSTHVDLLLVEGQDFIDGLVAMITEEQGDAVFVNVYGTLDPVLIGNLVREGIDFADLDLEGFGKALEDAQTSGED